MDKIRLQKILFPLTRRQEMPTHHFLPCRFGDYSFQAARDAATLAGQRGWLEAGEHHYQLCKEGMKEGFLALLNDEDGEQLDGVFQAYGEMCNGDP